MFITFEGGEGAGKSTLIKGVVAALSQLGFPVISTREPGGTPFGEFVREALLNSKASFSMCPRAELMLFLASRVQHIEEVILPALKAGAMVLCDRFNDSSVAYQGGGRGLGIGAVEDLCNAACENLQPDLTFFLDLEPAKGFSRIRREKDRMEGEGNAFHERVREGFKELKERHPDRIHVIDASQTPENVLEDVLHILSQKVV